MGKETERTKDVRDSGRSVLIPPASKEVGFQSFPDNLDDGTVIIRLSPLLYVILSPEVIQNTCFNATYSA